MKRLLSATVICGMLGLSACVAPAQKYMGASALTAYKWSLASGPLALTGADNVVITFGADGRLGIKGLCNHLGGAYEESSATVKITQIISTMMACSDDRKMKLEGEVGQALQGTHTIMITRSEPPQLNMKMQNGQTWLFRGTR